MYGTRRWIWPVWAAMSTVGCVLGFYVGFFLGHLVLGNLMLPIGIGAGVGLAQRPVLDRVIGGRTDPLLASVWPLASASGLFIGFMLGGAGASLLDVKIPFELSWPTGVLVWTVSSLAGGAAIGVMQYFLLRRHVGRTLWWVPASALGWSLSGTGWAIPALDRGEGLLPLLLAPTVAGLVLGLVTGGAVHCLFGLDVGEAGRNPT